MPPLRLVWAAVAEARFPMLTGYFSTPAIPFSLPSILWAHKKAGVFRLGLLGSEKLLLSSDPCLVLFCGEKWNPGMLAPLLPAFTVAVNE